MELLYKLSFKNQEHWEKVKESLATVKDENTTYPFYAFVEVGHVPYDVMVEEEGELVNKMIEVDGNLVKEIAYHEDWAVDVFSKVEIPKLNEYLIEAKDHYAHYPNGGNFKIVTK